MEESVKELTAPSGEVYGFRLLTYGEKMDISEKQSKGTKVKAGQKGFRKKPGERPEDESMEVELDMAVIIQIQRETVWRTLVKAPWLKPGQTCTKELVDKNVKGGDAEAINVFAEKLNYPKSDLVKKSDGQ